MKLRAKLLLDIKFPIKLTSRDMKPSIIHVIEPHGLKVYRQLETICIVYVAHSDG